MAKRQSNDLSRADKIRARNKQPAKETQTDFFRSNATRKQTSHKVPVTRRQTPHTPVINRQRGRVHVPLKTKGAELHLPALLRLQLGWRFISGALVLLSLAVIISFTSSSAFKVSAINLEGAQRLSSDAILSQLNLANTSIIDVKPAELETLMLERFPDLSSVQVSTGLPAEITIKATEREPLVLWQEDNRTLWIDADGVMFPVRGEAQVAQEVTAHGEPPAAEIIAQELTEETVPQTSFFAQASLPRTTPEFVQGILSLSGYLPEESTLQYDPQFGLGWQDPGGWLVYFGTDTTDIDLKLVEYQAILTRLQEANLAPVLISLEFLNAPFYRLEQ